MAYRAGVPLVFVPGGLGAADDYLAEFETFAPRRCLALSLRGQGKAMFLTPGMRLQNFVGDIEAVMLLRRAEQTVSAGLFDGCAVGIEYAARYPDTVSGLIIGDYPAHYPETVAGMG